MIPTERTIFPDDEYNPDLFSRQERAFLLRHIGETPRQVFGGKQPEELRPGIDIPKGVNPYAAFVLLQRFWEENQDEAGAPVLENVKRMTLACDVAQLRGEEQTRLYGGIDYASTGVGLQEGITRIRKAFVVSLSAKKFAPEHDWISDLSGSDMARIEELAADELQARAEKDKPAGSFAEDQAEEPAPEPINPEAVNILTMPCPYCFTPFSDPEPGKLLNRVHMHVQNGHKDKREQWAQDKVKFKEHLDAL